MIGPLPESSGNNAILVVVDMFSKEIIPMATTIELSSMGWARLYRDHVYCKHGLSRKIVIDRGPLFVSRFIKDFYTLMQIEGNPSTAYHPQTDRQTERANQEIETFLRIYCSRQPNTWIDHLEEIEFCHNN